MPRAQNLIPATDYCTIEMMSLESVYLQDELSMESSIGAEWTSSEENSGELHVYRIQQYHGHKHINRNYVMRVLFVACLFCVTVAERTSVLVALCFAFRQ